MAGTLRDRLREIEEEKNRWFRDRSAQAARLKLDLENAGREAWSAATRAGVGLQARTTQELQALGERVIDARRRVVRSPQPTRTTRNVAQSRSGTGVVARTQPPRQAPPTASDLREAALQADTAIRAAANILTFGGADHFAAGMDALLEPGGLEQWRQRYDANLAEEKARNRFDESHRSVAQVIGQVGGTALGVGLVGPARGAASLAPRLPGAAVLSGRETAALLGGGAAAGLGVQTILDAARGRRSSAGDFGGAALGGMAGAATLPLGPARAGAIDGLVTSAAQDMFNRRPISPERAGESAIAGGVLGGVVGRGGTRAADSLPVKAKGRLGEAMGDIRSTINSTRREWTPKSRDYLADGSYWYPDGRSGPLRFEDKFGYGAELSANQVRAQAELGPNFQLYHFTPDDVGGLLSMPASASAPYWVDGPRDRQR
jgi:hypothetical protein